MYKWSKQPQVTRPIKGHPKYMVSQSRVLSATKWWDKKRWRAGPSNSVPLNGRQPELICAATRRTHTTCCFRQEASEHKQPRDASPSQQQPGGVRAGSTVHTRGTKEGTCLSWPQKLGGKLAEGSAKFLCGSTLCDKSAKSPPTEGC